MSGGSFNYLCHKDVEDIYECRDEIKAMVEAFAEHGFKSAALATEEFLCLLENHHRVLTVRLNNLNDIWHAMEWFKSCDIGLDAVKEAVAKWEKTLGETT
jgi:hypothetical protein